MSSYRMLRPPAESRKRTNDCNEIRHFNWLPGMETLERTGLWVPKFGEGSPESLKRPRAFWKRRKRAVWRVATYLHIRNLRMLTDSNSCCRISPNLR